MLGTKLIAQRTHTMDRQIVVEIRPQTYPEQEVLKWRTNVKRVFMSSTIKKGKSRGFKHVTLQL
jgi:hypothetical protein